MRLFVLALLLALVLGTAQAVPLQGSDGNATVVLFGATRTPLDDENATEEILKVDVGLVGTENATYELLDQMIRRTHQAFTRHCSLLSVGFPEGSWFTSSFPRMISSSSSRLHPKADCHLPSTGGQRPKASMRTSS